ncbi:MAG: hypothetical protein HC924_15580, partial [Synechococcaceae cyanobacterium SM2_3_2]|nr:hypothetical protein [Synechococcaceae cyanobacterium SM2_3_2]
HRSAQFGLAAGLMAAAVGLTRLENRAQKRVQDRLNTRLGRQDSRPKDATQGVEGIE